MKDLKNSFDLKNEIFVLAEDLILRKQSNNDEPSLKGPTCDPGFTVSAFIALSKSLDVIVVVVGGEDMVGGIRKRERGDKQCGFS